MAFLKAKEINGLFHWDISDHESLDPAPEAFTASSFYYHHAKLASDFAGILGKKEDALYYENWSKRIKADIVNKYLVPNTGRFDNGTQAAQLFALWYNFAVDKGKSFEVLMLEFSRHNYHISTGIYGTKMLFDVLREANQNEAAYTITNQRTYPGWGYMLDEGATTLWETWKKPGTVFSSNHPMFGSVSEWFYRSLLGINAAEPGFRKTIIKPQPAGDLTWAKGSFNSLYGTISSEWKRENSQLELHVQIPANTAGEVWVPAFPGKTITESGKSLESQHLKVERFENGYAVITIPSGSYTFKSN